MRGRGFPFIQRDNFVSWERRNFRKRKIACGAAAMHLLFRERAATAAPRKLQGDYRGTTRAPSLRQIDRGQRHRQVADEADASACVRITGDEMDESLGDPAQRVLLATGAKASRQRACGHLSEASLAYPLFQPLRPRAQNAVAFRMGNHRL